MLNPGILKCSVFAGEWDDFRGFPVWSLFWPLITHNTFWHTFFLYVLFVIIQIQSTSIIWCLNKWLLNALVLYLFVWSMYTLDSLNLSRLALSSNPQHIQVTAVVASHFDSFPPEENENCSSRRVCLFVSVLCWPSCSGDTGELSETHSAKLLLYKSMAHSQRNLTPSSEQIVGLPSSGWTLHTKQLDYTVWCSILSLFQNLSLVNGLSMTFK